MLERDADGFIIGKLPESAKPYKNLSYLVVPEASIRFSEICCNFRLKLIISIIAK